MYSLSLNKRVSHAVLLNVFFLVFFSLKTLAQGNLLITPKRVVFDGSKRSEDVNLANTGQDTATYVISFIQIKMNEDGSFDKISVPDSGQQFADKNLRFFPRTVTLGPNEAQTVKVQLTNTNTLEPGEYRSHLYFRAVPKERPLGEVSPVKDSNVSVKLVPVFGISIPAIIRRGESTTKVNLSDVHLKLSRDTTPTLKITFNRTGNMSVYGDVIVDHIALNGKVTRVGVAKGLAVYTPTLIRHFNMLLTGAENVNLKSGKLHVVFETQVSEKSEKLAEAEIFLSEPTARIQ